MVQFSNSISSITPQNDHLPKSSLRDGSNSGHPSGLSVEVKEISLIFFFSVDSKIKEVRSKNSVMG